MLAPPGTSLLEVAAAVSETSSAAPGTTVASEAMVTAAPATMTVLPQQPGVPTPTAGELLQVAVSPTSSVEVSGGLLAGTQLPTAVLTAGVTATPGQYNGSDGDGAGCDGHTTSVDASGADGGPFDSVDEGH